MSAPATAAGTWSYAVTGWPSWPASSAATSRVRARSRPASRIPVSVRVAAMACACARPCTPVPMMASSAAPGLASRSVATAETAAVLTSVMADALISASGSPVRTSDSSTPPWCASLPTAGLPGVMTSAFSP